MSMDLSMITHNAAHNRAATDAAELEEMTMENESKDIDASTDKAAPVDVVVMRNMINMLPAYGSAAWDEISPEYREDALQDLDGLRCDIDFAREKLVDCAYRLARLEKAINRVLKMQPYMATKTIEACNILQEAIDA